MCCSQMLCNLQTAAPDAPFANAMMKDIPAGLSCVMRWLHSIILQHAAHQGPMLEDGGHQHIEAGALAVRLFHCLQSKQPSPEGLHVTRKQ